jgi:PAS domain S-box-containing protein
MSIELALNENLSKSELLSLIKKQEDIIYALQHNDRKCTNISNNSVDGIYRTAPDGTAINANSALVKMLGYNSKEELFATDISTQLYVDYNNRKEVIDHFSKTEKLRHKLYKKDGSTIWVENHGEAIKNKEGELLYYEGIIRDVTEVKRANEIQKVLLNISQRVYDLDNLKVYNRYIIGELGKLMDVSNSYIAYYNKDKQTISIPFISGEESDEEFPIAKTYTGYLIRNKKPLLLTSENFNELEAAGEVELAGVRSKVWLGVPLLIDDEIIGAIVLQSYDNEKAYKQSDIDLLELVSSHISIAVRRKRKSFELRKFSIAVEQSANTIVITDTKGNIEYVNAKFTETSGYKKEEAIGINPRILNSGKQDKKYYSDMWKTISSGVEWKGEFLNKSKSGKLYWERVMITPIKDFYGVITNYLAIKEEITLEKKKDEELAMSKEILRKVLDNIPIRVYWKDKESRFLGCNKSFYEGISFKSDEEVIGKTDYDWNTKEVADKTRNDELEIINTKIPKLRFIEKFIDNGEEVIFSSNKLPFIDQNNEVIGTIGTSVNITERLKSTEKLKIATEEAISANLSKSVFLSNMSHEIRTPLNAILGYSQLLQDDDNLTKGQYENLKTINRSGEHLLALINDILDMSKIEAGRITLKNADFNFSAVLKDVERLFKFKAAEKNIQLDIINVNYVPEIIFADESKIRQVIINLIGNAIKFTPEGFVQISVENLEGNFIKVGVKDSGIGILKEEQESVFRPFEQAKKGVKVSGGTGLGLAISKKFSNLMEGDITIESDYGKGSEFIFVFKYDESEQSNEKEEIEELKVVSLTPEMKGLKLAIVDDRFENRDILFQKLNPLGFDIQQAENGLDAVELYKKWKPDIILLDVVMPKLNGIEATRQILQLRGDHDVKIFIISASALESEQQEVMNIGATAFIKKPVHFVDLLTELVDKGNVEFIYEDQKKADINIGNPSEVSKELKEKFTNAALEGDFLLLEELLLDLENSTNKSFIDIENYIKEMEFEDLINWLTP